MKDKFYIKKLLMILLVLGFVLPMEVMADVELGGDDYAPAAGKITTGRYADVSNWRFCIGSSTGELSNRKSGNTCGSGKIAEKVKEFTANSAEYPFYCTELDRKLNNSESKGYFKSAYCRIDNTSVWDYRAKYAIIAGYLSDTINKDIVVSRDKYGQVSVALNQYFATTTSTSNAAFPAGHKFASLHTNTIVDGKKYTDLFGLAEEYYNTNKKNI